MLIFVKQNSKVAEHQSKVAERKVSYLIRLDQGFAAPPHRPVGLVPVPSVGREQAPSSEPHSAALWRPSAVGRFERTAESRGNTAASDKRRRYLIS